VRVVLVVHQFPPRFLSGTELNVQRVARALIERGHAVRVFTSEPCFDETPRYREADEAPGGIPTRYVTATPPLHPDRVLGEYYDPFVASRFGRFIEEDPPDVVHICHLAYVGAGVLEEAWLRGVPTVLQLFDFWPVCPRATLLRTDGELCDGPAEVERCVTCMEESAAFGYDQADGGDEGDGVELASARSRPVFLRESFELADLLVSPSRALRDVLVGNGHSERIELLGYAVDDDLAPLPPSAREVGLRFGFIGSLLPHKGPDLLLHAFARVDWPQARLVLRGDPDADPAYGARLREAAARDPRVHLAGPFQPDDLRTALSSIDVLVVPSLWRENTPFVALEARASGVPVVAADVAGLTEAVGSGTGAVLFERGDERDLAARLEHFRTDPGLRDRLRTELAPVKRMSEHADELVALYRRAGEAPRRVPAWANGASGCRDVLVRRRAAGLERHLLHHARELERKSARITKLERGFSQRLIVALSRMLGLHGRGGGEA